ncbi:MAG TPA: DUF1549 and DUF1553 domain-containing protein [Pirellulaceae bacterium]|jgi:hypothetical protein|nr:DUF1549 and DUF1553 domain-containing protein [Pirellulaceae bacterium]
MRTSKPSIHPASGRFGAGATLASAWLAAACLTTPFAAAEDSAQGADFAPVSIALEAGTAQGAPIVLIGSERRRQLIVTAADASGKQRDLTRAVAWSADPAGVVEVSPSGFVTPLGDGVATVVVSHGALTATVSIEVKSFEHDPPVNFTNEVVPVLTKKLCNSGGCHGKAGGQNGFRLSLLGFEPTEDYEHIARESRGRRLNPAAPERSLFLQKASGGVPHGGGPLIAPDSTNYRVLRRWIAEGAAFGDPEAARVASIAIHPATRTMTPESEQQLIVIAAYTDGSTVDVTAEAQYETNAPEMAEVDAKGLVRTSDRAGDVAVMVRYQSKVATFRATVPLGAPMPSLPPAKNFVDELAFAKLMTLGLPPSPVCDDATFLRRVTIDLAGRLPTPEEIEAFLADPGPTKRDAKIDALLASGDYADWFAKKWTAILRNKRETEEEKHGSFAFHGWIRESLHENVPYDRFVRGVIAASGEPEQNPGVIWYREVPEQKAQAEDAAQLFLGIRLQCAQCHHHPFERWSQEDYSRFGAFFAQVGRKPGALPGEERIFHKRGVATTVDAKTRQPVTPAGLGGEPLTIPADEDPRHRLVDWMTDPANPFFAKALANRYWKHFFGRGLIDPEDDLRETNPPTNPELLDALAKKFVESGYDLKELCRTICRSTTYQLSSTPNEFNADDTQAFSRYYPRRLPAEILLDAVDGATGSPSRFSGIPAGTRAVQLPDSAFNSYFLTTFGRPEGESACECERTSDADLSQALHLINSDETLNKISAGGGLAAKLAAEADTELRAKIRRIYLLAVSRPPTAEEEALVYDYVQRKTSEPNYDAKRAFEDVVWSLVNSKEFLFTR